MSKFIRSMLKEKGLFGEKKAQEKCKECHKKPAGKDGLCDSCRFDMLLTQIIDSRECS